MSRELINSIKRVVRQQKSARSETCLTNVPRDQTLNALANLSAQNKDDQLKALLAAHGITFTITPPEAGASAASSTPSKK